MPTLISTSCSAVGHPEIELSWSSESIPPKDAQAILDYLEGQVGGGTRFRPSETFQLGWIRTVLVERASGILQLQEPDFQSMPIKWIPGVDRALRDLRRQRDVADSVGLIDSLDFPDLGTAGMVYGSCDHAKQIVMEREVGEHRFSGWHIAFEEMTNDVETAEELRSLYEVALVAPVIVQFLALPAGSAVRLTDNKIAIFMHGKPLAFARGSYLDALQSKFISDSR